MDPLDDQAERSLSESHIAVSALKSGDPSAIGRWTDCVRPYLKQVVRRELTQACRNLPDEASDLVQATLVRVLQNLHQFRGSSISEWREWLAAIARHESRGAIRFWLADRRNVNRTTDMASGFEVAGEFSSPSSAMRQSELGTRLSQAMEHLSPEQRQLIGWRQQDGLSHREIASRLSTSEEASRQRCKQAMDALRRAWKAMGETDLPEIR